jgi:hypothetical protein
MAAKHTCIIELSDYNYEDLKNAVEINCEMKNLFWPQDLERAMARLAGEFYLDLQGKPFDEQIDYIKSYLGWALFIGICMGVGKKTHITRFEDEEVC